MLDVPLCGEPRAAYCYIHDGEAAAFQAYMQTELNQQVQVVASADLLAAGIFGPGKPHPGLTSRVGDFTVLPTAQHAIVDRVGNERGLNLVGVHGGLSSAELHVPLIVVEP